jgi:phosphotransferase system, enzyme I, PtsP
MLKLLRSIVEQVEAADSIESALDTIASRVVDALETQACAIFLANNDRHQFTLIAAVGYADKFIGRLTIPFNQGLIGYVADRREPLNLEDSTTHEHYENIKGLAEKEYHAFLGIPILHRRKLLGILIVEQVDTRRFDEAEEAFLVTMTTQLGSVIAEAEAKGNLSYDRHANLVPKVLRGIPSASGVSIGTLVPVFPLSDFDAVPDEQCKNPEAELTRFVEALELTKKEIRLLGNRLSENLPAEERALFDVYIQLLESESLFRDITDKIKQCNTAESALKHTIRDHLKQFNAMENEYLKERATDIEDLGRRILSHLQEHDQDDIEYPENTIIIGNQLTATHLAEIPEGRLKGVISSLGSSNSHIAILARALGIPSVMGVGDMPLSKLRGLEAVVDGYIGQAYISPNKRLLDEFQALADEEHALDSELELLRELPAETEDGHRVELFVNTGLMSDVSRSLTSGAEGVGLYRTEVPFMTRDRFPTLEEQRVLYRQLLNVFSPRPVVMRVLDIGGDKPLPYFPIVEDNPFLGWRGIRLLLEHPDIFLTQIRAMLRASEGFNNLHIMLPLITDLGEVDESTRMIKTVYKELKDEGLEIVMPKIGIMVEVPSAVYEAYHLAQRVDFLSVGSNDLTQYILAVDRNNSHVANLYDSLHPAVLKALKQVVEGAHQAGKTVSICGEMSGDPAAAILLIAMGFDMLSVNAPVLPRIKWVIRKFKMNEARKILSEVLTMNSSSEIRRHLDFVLEEAGLGGLIRAGRH